MNRPRLRLLAGLLAVLAPAAQAQTARTGTVAKRYAELCANCHGDKLQGAQAPSMLDDSWLVGGDDASIEKSIRTGFPDKGMPAWGNAIPDKEIRAMVIFIREQRDLARRGQLQFNKPADSVTTRSQLHDFQVNTWVGGLKEPYSLAFLNPDLAVVTEKRGHAFLVEKGKLAARPLLGLPVVDAASQAGLYDVVPHPDYARNGWVYLAFADPKKDADGKPVSLTRIIRGRIKDGALIDQETVYQARPEHYIKAGGVHFGGRIAFDRQGFLFFTIGERGQGPHAQDITRPNGKVHRIHDDGRVPADNPFVKNPEACATIWSYGHRNPQGAAIGPDGVLWVHEHGPQGGDEVNRIERGRNYGWPKVSYGCPYGAPKGEACRYGGGVHEPTYEPPVSFWVPTSIGPSGLVFYSGRRFPQWHRCKWCERSATGESGGARRAAGMGIGAGVQFHHRRAQGRRA